MGHHACVQMILCIGWGERKRILFVPGAMLGALPCYVLKTVPQFCEVVNCISDLLHNKLPPSLMA